MERQASDKKENSLEESSILNKDINHHENGEVADNMSRNSFNHPQLLTQEGEFMSCYYNLGETETSDVESINCNNENRADVQELINQSEEVSQLKLLNTILNF